MAVNDANTLPEVVNIIINRTTMEMLAHGRTVYLPELYGSMTIVLLPDIGVSRYEILSALAASCHE